MIYVLQVVDLSLLYLTVRKMMYFIFMICLYQNIQMQLVGIKRKIDLEKGSLDYLICKLSIYMKASQTNIIFIIKLLNYILKPILQCL